MIRVIPEVLQLPKYNVFHSSPYSLRKRIFITHLNQDFVAILRTSFRSRASGPC